MFVQAEIFLDKKAMPFLPMDALVKQDNKYYVLKLVNEDDKNYFFEKVEVEIDLSEEGKVSLNNITLDEKQYLTKGAYFLIQ